MNMKPDLSRLDPEIIKYIESLEAEIEMLRKSGAKTDSGSEQAVATKTSVSEPPTTLHLITITAGGIAKRTPRHFYISQGRGGMGIFDLETPAGDPPYLITIADESQHLLLFTSLGRVFRIPVALIDSAEIRARGKPLTGKVTFLPDERVATVLPDQARGAVALVTALGYVRVLRHHIFGEYMRPGTGLLEPQKFGEITAGCWTSGNDDLFIATRQGRAIRFPERSIPPQGGQGVRLEGGDIPVAVTSVTDDAAVFLVDAQGLGTLRLMSGFSANKSAGGGGKIAMKTHELVSAYRTHPSSDIFLLSGLSKLIRFAAVEVPEKEDPVQGVRCMDLRADKVVSGIST